jgi:hypothetical protein
LPTLLSIALHVFRYLVFKEPCVERSYPCGFALSKLTTSEDLILVFHV